MMDEASNSLSSQHEEDAKSIKKIKTYRPIILLRRNSCTGIASKSSAAHVGIPRQKSANDIQSRVVVTAPSGQRKPCKSSAIKQSTLTDKVKIEKTDVKTELVEFLPSMSSWISKANEESIMKPQNIVRLTQTKFNTVQPSINKTTVNGQKPLTLQAPLPMMQMQPNCAGMTLQQPVHSGMPMFSDLQQFKAISQVAIPMRDSYVNQLCPVVNEQLSNQPSFHCSPYFYSQLVPNQAPSLQMQNNRQIFYQQNKPHANLSEGM